MTNLLKHFTSLFAGFTIGYWLTIILNISQASGHFLVVFGAIIFLIASIKLQDRENSENLTANIPLLFFSIGLAIFTSCLYAFNPDDSTFFHRVAHLLQRENEALPSYDTRLAFDHLPSISAAHLVTSWEYFLSWIGNYFHSAVIGYQIGGTFVSIIFYIAAATYTLRHFFPRANSSSQIFSIVVLILFLIFDADQNRRIGSWLFLGGWTGKCFLSAALIALFPAMNKALETNNFRDWFFAFCLIIFFVGLSGSALFIVPIGLAVLIVVEKLVDRDLSTRYSMLLLLMPVVVGMIFIYKFGGLKDDSYWRGWSKMPFFDYIRLTISDRQFWLYAGLIPILNAKVAGRNNRAVKNFAIYQIALAVVLFNPYIVAAFQTYVPPDGFWRTYYLFQYPTALIILITFVFHSVQEKFFRLCVFPGLALILSLVGASSIFTLQKTWGYPEHFKSIFQPKLPTNELQSVQRAAKNCPSLQEGGIVLAPEPWEVTVQMLFPSVTSVAARHMRHNFLNANVNDIIVAESIRRDAVDYISGTSLNSIEAFSVVLERSVAIVVVRREAAEIVSPLLFNYKQVAADEKYLVYCLNRRTPNE